MPVCRLRQVPGKAGGAMRPIADIRRIAGDFADARNRVGRKAAVGVVARLYGIAPANVLSALEQFDQVCKDQRSAPPVHHTPDDGGRFKQAMAAAKAELIRQGRWPEHLSQ